MSGAPLLLLCHLPERLDDEWGDDGWDEEAGASKPQPVAKYVMAEVTDDFYPDNHEDLALMRYARCARRPRHADALAMTLCMSSSKRASGGRAR